MRDFKGVSNAFSIGRGSTVITIPKEVADEIGIDTENKKTFFNVYYDKNKKQVIYEFSKHAKKNKKE